MANKKVTELPENTSWNDNDKHYVVTAAGVSKCIRASTIKAAILADVDSSGGGRSHYKGRHSTEANLLIAYPNDDPDAEAGDYAQVGETNSYWERNPTTLEWFDTGDVIDDVELDLYPTLGNNDRAATSGGTKELLDQKAEAVHDHSITETWLTDILANYLLSSQFSSTFWAALKAALQQGSGVTLTKNETTKTVTINAIGGDGDPITIDDVVTEGSGNAVSSGAVYDELQLRINTTDWEEATGDPVILAWGGDYYKKFIITATADIEIDEPTTTRTDAIEGVIKVILSGIDSVNITVPSTFKDGNGRAFPGNVIELTGYEINDEVVIPILKDGGNYKLLVPGADGDSSAPNSFAALTGAARDNADLDSELDQVLQDAKDYTDELVTDAIEGVWDDQGNYDASGDTFPVAADTNPVVAEVKKGFIWTISEPGTLGGEDVVNGQTVRAIIDDPGQTAGNWAISKGSSEIPNASESVPGKAEIGTQTETNDEEDDARIVTAKKLSEKPVYKESYTATQSFAKRSRDTYVDQSANIVLDADFTGAKHGSEKIIFVNGNNSNSLTFTAKYEKIAGSLDFDNSKLNHIYCVYNSYAQKVYYNILQTSRLVSDLTPPTINSSSLNSANKFVDIIFNEGVFTTSGGSGGLVASDFTLTFTQNGGTATACVITSVKRNDSNDESSASALIGGENTIRVFLTITGNTNGSEYISIKIATNTSVYDASGNACLATQTTGNLTLNVADITAPVINAGVMASNSSYIDVVFSEGVFTSAAGGPVTTADLSLTFVQGSGSATNTTISSITTTTGGALVGGESTIRCNLAITGSQNGQETIEIKPASGTAIYDGSGNAMASAETTGPVNLINASYSAEALAVFALMPDALPTSTKNAMAAFIDSQVTVGNWSKIEEFQFYGLNTEANALKGWKGKANATLVNGAIFNTGSNVQTDGVNDHLDTGFTPSTAAVITQNNSQYGVWVKEWNHTASVSKALFGCLDGTRYNQLFEGSSNNLLRTVNSNNSPVSYTGESVFAANSLYCMARGLSTTSILLKNGNVVASDSQTSTGLPTRVLTIGARNNNGSFDSFASAKYICFVACQYTSFAQADFYSNLQTLITALGA